VAPPRESRLRAVLAACVALVAFAVFSNTLLNGFVYDDKFQVLANPWIRDVAHLPDIFLSNPWEAGEELAGAPSSSSNYYRPFAHLSYLVTFHLFGMEAWAFHLVNVLLHSGCSVLVFLLAARFLGDRGRARSAPWLAAAAGVLFAVHPVHTEPVAWIESISDPMFSLFFLLSLYLYSTAASRGRIPGARYAGSIAAFAFALLAKEPALVLPAVLVAHDYAFARPSLVGRPLSHAVRYVPYAVVAIAYLVQRWIVLGGLAPVEAHGQLGLTTYQCLINVGPLLLRYLGKIVLPIGLTAYSSFHVTSLAEPWAIAGLIALPLVAYVAWVFLRRSERAFLGLTILLLPLAPVLYIRVVQANTLAERYVYLPSVGFLIIVFVGVERLVRARPRALVPLAVAFCLVAGLAAVGTVRRNAVWRSDDTLWAETLRRPVDPVKHVTWGNNLLSRGSVAEAIEQYRMAVELRPGDADAQRRLGVACAANGDYDEALRHLTIASTIEADAVVYHNIGLVYRDMNRPAEAIENFRRALEIEPGFVPAERQLAALAARP